MKIVASTALVAGVEAILPAERINEIQGGYPGKLEKKAAVEEKAPVKEQATVEEPTSAEEASGDELAELPADFEDMMREMQAEMEKNPEMKAQMKKMEAQMEKMQLVMKPLQEAMEKIPEAKTFAEGKAAFAGLVHAMKEMNAANTEEVAGLARPSEAEIEGSAAMMMYSQYIMGDAEKEGSNADEEQRFAEMMSKMQGNPHASMVENMKGQFESMKEVLVAKAQEDVNKADGSARNFAAEQVVARVPEMISIMEDKMEKNLHAMLGEKADEPENQLAEEIEEEQEQAMSEFAEELMDIIAEEEAAVEAALAEKPSTEED